MAELCSQLPPIDKGLREVKTSLYFKKMLKRSEECDTHLVHIFTHHCSGKNPVKDETANIVTFINCRHRLTESYIIYFIFSPGSVLYSESTNMSQVGVALFPSF